MTDVQNLGFKQLRSTEKYLWHGRDFGSEAWHRMGRMCLRCLQAFCGGRSCGVRLRKARKEITWMCWPCLVNDCDGFGGTLQYVIRQIQYASDAIWQSVKCMWFQIITFCRLSWSCEFRMARMCVQDWDIKAWSCTRMRVGKSAPYNSNHELYCTPYGILHTGGV